VVLCSDCLEGYLVGEVHLPAAATS
jgi:hypothetical protein